MIGIKKEPIYDIITLRIYNVFYNIPNAMNNGKKVNYGCKISVVYFAKGSDLYELWTEPRKTDAKEVS